MNSRGHTAIRPWQITGGIFCKRVHTNQCKRLNWSIRDVDKSSESLEYYERYIERRLRRTSTGIPDMYHSLRYWLEITRMEYFKCSPNWFYKRSITIWVGSSWSYWRYSYWGLRSNTNRHAPRVIQDWVCYWTPSFESANGDSQSDEFDDRRSHARRRYMLMSESYVERQHRDEIYLQLISPIWRGRTSTWWTVDVDVGHGQAETTRLGSQVIQEGKYSRVIIESTSSNKHSIDWDDKSNNKIRRTMKWVRW